MPISVADLSEQCADLESQFKAAKPANATLRRKRVNFITVVRNKPEAGPDLGLIFKAANRNGLGKNST